MDRGTYAAASASILQLSRLEIESNNLANINTAGYKRQILTSRQQSFEDTLAAKLNIKDPFQKGDQARVSGVIPLESVTDFTAGSIQSTGNDLDVALRNPQDFFVINTPQGQQYTRAGNFTLNAAGEIVTPDGAQVVGDGGALVATGGPVTIAEDGSVLVNNARVGRLQVVRVDEPASMERVGSTRFKVPQGGRRGTEVDPEVVPKSLEMANVSSVSSMVELMSAQRRFDMATKAIQTSDQLNIAAIDLGKSK